MINVVAKKSTKCPKEGKPRKYIADDTPVEVSATAYYRRLIKDGSLELKIQNKKTEVSKQPSTFNLQPKPLTDKGGKK